MSSMSVLIVGSIALDTVKTPLAEHADLLGGSASYAAVSASFFGPVNLVGVVGDDFPGSHIDYFKSRAIDLEGTKSSPVKLSAGPANTCGISTPARPAASS